MTVWSHDQTSITRRQGSSLMKLTPIFFYLLSFVSDLKAIL